MCPPLLRIGGRPSLRFEGEGGGGGPNEPDLLRRSLRERSQHLRGRRGECYPNAAESAVLDLWAPRTTIAWRGRHRPSDWSSDHDAERRVTRCFCAVLRTPPVHRSARAPVTPAYYTTQHRSTSLGTAQQMMYVMWHRGAGHSSESALPFSLPQNPGQPTPKRRGAGGLGYVRKYSVGSALVGQAEPGLSDGGLWGTQAPPQRCSLRIERGGACTIILSNELCPRDLDPIVRNIFRSTTSAAPPCQQPCHPPVELRHTPLSIVVQCVPPTPVPATDQAPRLQNLLLSPKFNSSTEVAQK